MDQNKVEAFVGKTVSEMATAITIANGYIGEQLGLYRVLAGAGPLTSEQLAARTETNARLVREWCHTQTVGGVLEHDPTAGTFELPPEHAFVLADEDSPVYLAGMLEVAAGEWAGTDRIIQAFQGNGGVGWHEQDQHVFHGVERLFGPLYRHQLPSQWIPALDGVEDKLRAGARIADVGCGHGVSTVVLAETYPECAVVGTDYHAASIEAARKNAAAAGVADRTRFEIASATGYSGQGYDLICFFDCLHDMGDPVGAARHARSALAEDGTVLLVEPKAGDDLTENHNPISQLYYAGSVILCVPNSLSQDVGRGLGAQAGPARLEQVFREAGFTRFRQATEAPFNLVLEARP